MNTGQWIVIYILSQLVIIAVWDIWAFKSQKMTASRYIIKQAKLHRLIARLVFLFCCAVVVLGIWLFAHWCLPQILFEIWEGKFGC